MGKVLVTIMIGSMLATAYYGIAIALLVLFLPYAIVSDIIRRRDNKRYQEVHQMFFDGKITISELIKICEDEKLEMKV